MEIKVPMRGTGRETMDMAIKNGKKAIYDYNKSAGQDKARNIIAANQLANAIGLSSVSRIEAYDISTTGGENSVGSMAVFQEGELAKSEYRHFRIKTIEGVNDYGSLQEILTRRLSHLNDKKGSFSKIPQLILADGGIAQASVIASVVKKAGANVPVYGMVKDSHHKTRALVSIDGEIIPVSDEAFRLISMIQEEVHRIAIGYHRKLRSKSMVHSVLEDIPGVGSGRRVNLIKHFKSIKAIENASADEISKVKGISKNLADTIYLYFKNKKD